VAIVEVAAPAAPAWTRWRKGEDGRRLEMVVWAATPRLGELLRSVILLSDGSSTVIRTGDVGGNASSVAFFGTRTRLGEGEPDGLAGRIIGE
jgi:hypothetical protein